MYFYLSKIAAPFLNITNVLILIIILLLFFCNISSKKKINFIKNFIVILFFFISFLPIGNLGLKYLENKFLNQKKLINIDNIILLAGSENINHTKITSKTNLNDGSERLIASVKLGLENIDSKIFFLGGDGNLVKNDFDETDVAKKFYSDVGFDISRVKFIKNTRNTVENLQEFKIHADNKKVNVLITSAFHMKRSMMIAKKLNINLIPYAVDFRSINHLSLINYYQRFRAAENIRAFDIFFRELLGIIAFKLFY